MWEEVELAQPSPSVTDFPKDPCGDRCVRLIALMVGLRALSPPESLWQKRNLNLGVLTGVLWFACSG